MTRLGLGCLQVFYEEKFDNILDAKTINELLKIPRIFKVFDYQKLYRTLNVLLEEGYVGIGAKNGRSNTFYITAKGKELIQGFC